MTTTTKNIETAAQILTDLAGPIPAADTLIPTRPDDTDLDTLGQHAQRAAKAGAEKAWELGRALVLVKNRTTKKEYADWLKKWVPDIHDRTRLRYEKIGVLDFDTIKGKKKDDVYRLVFGDDYATGKNEGAKGAKLAAVRKKFAALSDDAFLEVAIKHGIDADAVKLRAFISDLFDAVK